MDNNNEAIENTGKSNLALSATVLLLMNKLKEKKKTMSEGVTSPKTGIFLGEEDDTVNNDDNNNDDNNDDNNNNNDDDDEYEEETIGYDQNDKLYPEYKKTGDSFVDDSFSSDESELGSDSDYTTFLKRTPSIFEQHKNYIKIKKEKKEEDELNLYLKDIVESMSKWMIEKDFGGNLIRDQKDNLKKKYLVTDDIIGSIRNKTKNEDLEKYSKDLYKAISKIRKSNNDDDDDNKKLQKIKNIFREIMGSITARTEPNEKLNRTYNKYGKINYNEIFNFIEESGNLVTEDTTMESYGGQREQIKHNLKLMYKQLHNMVENALDKQKTKIFGKEDLKPILYKILNQIIYPLRESNDNKSVITLIDNLLFTKDNTKRGLLNDITFGKETFFVKAALKKDSNFLFLKFIKDEKDELKLHLHTMSPQGKRNGIFYLIRKHPTQEKYDDDLYEGAYSNSQVFTRKLPSSSSKMPKGPPPYPLQRNQGQVRNIGTSDIINMSSKPYDPKSQMWINPSDENYEEDLRKDLGKDLEEDLEKKAVAIINQRDRKTRYNSGLVVDNNEEDNKINKKVTKKKRPNSNSSKIGPLAIEDFEGGKRKTRKNRKRN
tara:strand:+ start:930 stop:2732 length:1803 start_codon:yes stop_codon:yes gene_type:complete